MRVPTLNRNKIEVEETAPEETPEREFSHHDRCDRCGFQAYFVAVRARTVKAVGIGIEGETTQELVFCKHHGEKAAAALDKTQWTVLDFTHMLDKPLVSANVD